MIVINYFRIVEYLVTLFINRTRLHVKFMYNISVYT